jgi:hypothetical protein
MHDAAVEAKVQFATKHVQLAYLNGRSPIFSRWGTNILMVLASVSPDALKEPQFASATMGRDQNGEYRLFLFWLEDKPSVDGLELCLSKTNATATVPMAADDISENRKSSEVSVVMRASWIWSSSNSICAKLEDIKDVSSIKLRLLRSGSPVSGWCPVSFYRLDHWMGSKVVTEVTTGDTKGN